MTQSLTPAGTSRAATLTRATAALRPYPQRCKLCSVEQEASPAAICENCLGPLEPL